MHQSIGTTDPSTSGFSVAVRIRTVGQAIAVVTSGVVVKFNRTGALEVDVHSWPLGQWCLLKGRNDLEIAGTGCRASPLSKPEKGQWWITAGG